MSHVSDHLREQVILRAGNRCEYCRLSQIGQEATFHMDHVVPQSSEGPTTADNLALACVSCSLRKSARMIAPDPETGEEVPLFNPRSQKWLDHFWWDDEHVVSTTSIGRATESALALNRALILAIRKEEMLRGRHPPSE